MLKIHLHYPQDQEENVSTGICLLNSLHPNISMYIILTVFYAFLCADKKKKQFQRVNLAFNRLIPRSNL